MLRTGRAVVGGAAYTVENRKRRAWFPVSRLLILGYHKKICAHWRLIKLIKRTGRAQPWGNWKNTDRTWTERGPTLDRATNKSQNVKKVKTQNHKTHSFEPRAKPRNFTCSPLAYSLLSSCAFRHFQPLWAISQASPFALAAPSLRL